MRRVCQSLAVASTLLLVPAMPASAAGGTVTTSYWWRAAPVTGGYAVAYECDAAADPGASGDLALLTIVTCSVNGVVSSGTAPGSRAVIANVIAARTPITLCRQGTATFLDFQKGTSYPASSNVECTTLLTE